MRILIVIDGRLQARKRVLAAGRAAVRGEVRVVAPDMEMPPASHSIAPAKSLQMDFQGAFPTGATFSSTSYKFEPQTQA